MKTRFPTSPARLPQWMVTGLLALGVTTFAIQAQAAWILADNFESYNAGTLASGVTGGTWTGIFSGTANATIAAADENKVLRYWGTGGGGSGDWRGAVANLATSFSNNLSLAHGASGTYFLQMRHEGGNIDNVFGLSDIAVTNNNPWQQYATTLSLVSNGNLRAWNGSADILLATITPGDWFNVWIYVDNASKTFKVGHSVGAADATVHETAFSFGRRGAADASIGFLAFTTLGTGPGVMVDNIHFASGENFVNPIPEPSTYALLFGAVVLLGTAARRRFRKA
jgi:hypothetical protein